MKPEHVQGKEHHQRKGKRLGRDDLLFIAGWWMMTRALMENAFAAPVVKYQEERQHTVIDRCVYNVARHPMYAGAVPLLVGMSLWLESYAAAALASVPIAMLAARIIVEQER